MLIVSMFIPLTCSPGGPATVVISEHSGMLDINGLP